MLQCVHCDEPAALPVFLSTDQGQRLPFCCRGCLTVYEVLKELRLTSYYEIKNQSGVIKRRSPVDFSPSGFNYLDDVRFKKDHCYFTPDENPVMDFYLEGIHCLACLWLIEKLPELLPEVLQSKLNLENSTVSITVSGQGKFSEAARELNRLGYKPHALNRNDDAKKFQELEDRSFLRRLGIAGAATGNIMIYSVSLYGGATESLGEIFQALTVILAIPVFTYCAWPFYQSAWTSLKNRTLSIDIPIAMSLIMGFLMGSYGLFHHSEENYFDSLTALVFLLLLSRYFLKKIQTRGLAVNDLNFFYSSESVLRKTENGFEDVHTDFLSPGDIVLVRRDEFFPADGTILKGDSFINNSLLTGESLPDHVKAGHAVFSGTQNLGNELLVRLDRLSKDTRLGNILRNVEQGWGLRSRTVDLTSAISKYFTLSVIILAIGLFISLVPEKGFSFALTRALTLLIVTCPCALAISVPLTFHRSLSQAARHGIIVKSDEVFEKLASAKKIFLDKTGTITLGHLKVYGYRSDRSLFDIIYSLERNSKHPVGRALAEFALHNQAQEKNVEGLKEVPGRGVEGFIDGLFYEIINGEVFEGGHVIATFVVRDVIRRDSKEIISRLQKSGHELTILSGDRSDVVESLAREAGISSVHSQISPERKVELVKSSGGVMVGDGANDAMALSSADVGIAVSGAMDISLRASDVYLSTPGLSGVEKLFTLSLETMKVVKRNLLLSLVYNSCSVFLVFTGFISPLVAAIIMPTSSLTVLVSTLLGTQRMRALWKS
jgi:Cu2+-exporting ATPase/Cu+-exporting ATPase